MAPLSELIKVTAVPSGVDSSSENLYLSVVLSPELSGGGGTLAGTDFENWPDRLESYQNDNGSYGPAYWDVVLSDGGGDVLFEQFVFLQTSSTDDLLWTSLFPPTTTHTSAASRASQTESRADTQTASRPDDRFRSIPIISYPATQVMDFITGQYQHYSPTELPDLATMSAVYAAVSDGLIGVVGDAHVAAQARERAASSRGATVAAANDFTDASTSEAFAAFKAYQTAGSGSPPPTGVDPIDFHAALTFIGQHGVLQRALGLVFDLTVPYGGSAAAQHVFSGATLNSDVYLSVSLFAQSDSSPLPPRRARDVISRGRFGFTQVSPRTQCDANATTFTAHSASGDIVGGLLDGTSASNLLKPYPMSIVGDVNATSQLPYKLRTIQRAQAKKGVYSSGDFDTSGYVAPPSLRSSGLTLAQVGAATRLADQLARSYASGDAAADAIAAGDGSTLLDFAAEDLVRGYVLDVYDVENGVWRSTAERNISYTSSTTGVSGPTSEPFDEAAVQAPPRIVNPPDGESEQFVLSEIILSYNGWSNAVARPGTALADNDSSLSAVDPQFPAGNPQFPASNPLFHLNIVDSVPAGRLAPLRFGHNYHLRVRVIDLANNKVSVSDVANNRHYTDPMLYGRFEPIAAPDIYPQSLPRPGESLKTLVIRDVDRTTPSLRALYPQRVSGQFAEAHGMFDTAAGALDPGAYATIVPRESGEYPDPPPDTTTQPSAIAFGEPVPFLPDPLVRGGALVFSVEGGVIVADVSIDFFPQNGADWPDYRPFGLELVAGSAFGSNVDDHRRVLTVTLGPADVVGVKLTATCNPGDVSLFAMPPLFKVTPDAVVISKGGQWAVTPATELKLVYAVQTPLATPELESLFGERFPGDTTASIQGRLAWSPKSTAEVDIVAAWAEPVDNPTLDQLQGPGAPNPALREISGSPAATVSEGHTQLAVGTSLVQASANDPLTATDPLSFDHQLFDTKHRVVTYSGVASSRFADYYPDGTPVSVSSATPVTVNILSSARPEPPSITDVIPIYDWDLRGDPSSKVISERKPSALRVLIARPWWSSGIGELLGVITNGDETNAKFTIAPDSGESDWAADPVFSSAALPSRHPLPSAFPNAVRSDGFIAGHAVAFDATRNCWYCDIKVNTGQTYTPMIRLALARWQPDSLDGLALSRVVTTQIMSLEPGRTLTVVHGKGGSLSSVQLSGYSYTRAAHVVSPPGPGLAQVQVERRDHSIKDPELGWELVGAPIRMSSSQGSKGLSTWTARDVKLAGKGPHRIVVTQYETLPGGDSRTAPAQATDVTFSRPGPGRDYRLVHQDIVQL